MRGRWSIPAFAGLVLYTLLAVPRLDAAWRDAMKPSMFLLAVCVGAWVAADLLWEVDE